MTQEDQEDVDVQEVVDDEDQEDIQQDDDDDKRLAAAEKRLAAAEKRLADARSDLTAARSDLTAAEKTLAEAKEEEERDEEYIKDCKQEIKDCKQEIKDFREYVNKCQQHVTTMQNLLEEAASTKVCPSAKKLKMEQRYDAAYLTRCQRWDKLNAVFLKIAKKKPKKKVKTCSYSDIRWKNVQGILILSPSTIIPQGSNFFTEDNADSIFTVLEELNKNTRTVQLVTELQSFVFINAIMSHVCSKFDGIQFLYEKEICGSYLQTKGRFELVIQKGSSVICLLEARKEDMAQGMAQCLVGCEAVSDKDQCNIVYGIVSSYIQWELFESRNDRICNYDRFSLQCTNFLPTRLSLVTVLNKLHSFIDLFMQASTS